jgi:hypothetical protein
LNNNGIYIQVETFKVCPRNFGVFVGRYGTIKNRATGEVLEQIISEKGYMKVKNPQIFYKNMREYEFVHRLVALTYIPGYSNACWICHHKDNDKRNNLPENLIWSSPEMHDKLHGIFPRRRSGFMWPDYRSIQRIGMTKR